MLTIDPERDVWTVVVTVDADATSMYALEAHARFGLTEFAKYPGYLGGALHVSDDRTRLVQYLQWRSREEYVACRDDARWGREPTTRAFMELMLSGKARVDARGVKVVAVYPGGDAG